LAPFVYEQLVYHSVSGWVDVKDGGVLCIALKGTD